MCLTSHWTDNFQYHGLSVDNEISLGEIKRKMSKLSIILNIQNMHLYKYKVMKALYLVTFSCYIPSFGPGGSDMIWMGNFNGSSFLFNLSCNSASKILFWSWSAVVMTTISQNLAYPLSLSFPGIKKNNHYL